MLTCISFSAAGQAAKKTFTLEDLAM